MHVLTAQPIADLQAWSVQHNSTVPSDCRFALSETAEIHFMCLGAQAVFCVVLYVDILYEVTYMF